MSKTESRKLSDDYEVAGVLGRGGFSIVRKGVSKSEGRTEVAIKTLRRLGPAMMGPPLQQGSKAGLPMWKQVSISDALLTNEILVMRRIVESVAPHPNVIGLHDVAEFLQTTSPKFPTLRGTWLYAQYQKLSQHKTASASLHKRITGLRGIFSSYACQAFIVHFKVVTRLAAH